MKSVDVHREMQAILHRFHRISVELVGLVDALRVPICPVQLVLEQRQGEGMWQTCK